MERFVLSLVTLSSFACAQEKVTYDDHVLPLFQSSCLNCHNPDKTKGGLDLSSFTGTLKGSSGGKIVEPGDPGSTLINVVRQTAEPKMPPEGERLTHEQIDILKRWIEGGLLENSSSTARKASKPKFGTSPRSDPAAKPEGPPPMPADLLLEPPLVTDRAAAIHALAASPWAPLLAVTSQRQILLVNTESLELAGILPFPEGDPVSLAFTPDARYLIVGGGVPGKSGVTVTFDVTNGSRLLCAAKEFDTVLAADIRPGFDIVATGGPSRLLKFWNTGTGDLTKSIKKHTDWITALDLSPDGVLLASGDRNGGVWVWESDSGNEFHTLRAHQAAITATVFRADSDILATTSEDGTLRFWEMNGGSEVKKIDAHPGGVTAFSFARDGTSLTTGRDLKARLWKPDFTPAREIVGKLPALPTAAVLDAEGKRAFIGDSRGVVTVFNIADGKALGEIPGNPPAIDTRLKEIATLISNTTDPAALAMLNASQKRWSAAAINTRALETRRVAAESADRTEEAQDAFTMAADKITRQAAALNLKRNEREQLNQRDEDTEALASLDNAIARELEALRAAESAFEEAARSIDPNARLAQDKKLEAAALMQAYQQALK
jgi:mono/diheme cytochrome c family protein